MAYKYITPRLGGQPIGETSTTKKHNLGEMVEAVDDTNNGGVGQFIYVQASNSITQYDAVAIKGSHKIAPLTITNAKTAVEVGFCQIAVGTKDSYCWVMKNGRPIVRCALACQPDVPLYATATGGVLDDASTSAMLQGLVAITQVTNSAGPTTCVARYPTVMAGEDA
jgi:hypothetical protein